MCVFSIGVKMELTTMFTHHIIYAEVNLIQLLTLTVLHSKHAPTLGILLQPTLLILLLYL